MRIIAGRWRGRKLTALEGSSTRPMLDRVREALFNVIAPRIEGALVWDLFAGTGSLGLEALSRGAEEVLFIERARAALAVLEANIEACTAGEGPFPGRVHRGDAWGPPSPAGRPPELIFLDPPYAQVRSGGVELRHRLLSLQGALAPGGLLLFHYDLHGPPGEQAWEGLEPEKRSWGGSALAMIDAVPEEA